MARTPRNPGSSLCRRRSTIRWNTVRRSLLRVTKAVRVGWFQQRSNSWVVLFCAAMLVAPSNAAQAELAAGPRASVQQPKADGAEPSQQRVVAPRLLDTVKAPLFYLGVEPGDGDASEQSTNRSSEGVLPIQELLSDASLPLLLGWQSDGPAAAALSLLRRFLKGSESDLELALTNIVTAGLTGDGERPLMIFRGRLGAAEAQAVRLLLGSEERAALSRTIQGHQVFSLKGVSEDVPGGLVEVAVLGRDLVVSNHGLAMEQVLLAAEPAPGAAAAPKRTATSFQQPLSTDPRYQKLRRNVELKPGGILLFADGPRLSRRLLGNFAGRRSLPMLKWSGLIRARAMLSALQPRDGSGGFIATVMVDFGDAENTDQANQDGWVTTLMPRSARDLAAVLPGVGVGGVSVAFSADALLANGSSTGSNTGAGALLRDMRAACADGCAQAGVDFDKQILRRLTGHGALHLLSGVEGGMGHAWSFRARSAASARSIFRDLSANSDESPDAWVQLQPARDGMPELLRIRSGRGGHLWLANLAGDMVLAESRAALATLLEHSSSAGRRQVARRKDTVLDALQLLGRTTRSDKGLLGAFDIDLMPGLERWMAEQHGDDGVQALQGSVLPLRWIGFLDRTDGLLRLQVLGRR